MKIFKQSFLLLFVLLAAFLCLTSCKKTDPCPNGHNFAIWETVTRATCGVAGLESSECTACGHYTEREIPPTGKHKLNDWEILSHATLTTDGRKTRSCALCKQTVNDEPIPAFGATYSAVAADEKLSVLLSQYTVVYQNGVQGTVFADNARALASAIKALSGTAVSTLDHIACPADDTRYEILIGDTDRALSQSAKAKISEVVEIYGNPSSLHSVGQSAEKVINTARDQILACLGVRKREDTLIFTSCGTEATSTALFGTAFAKTCFVHCVS